MDNSARILVATANPGKLREVRRLLKGKVNCMGPQDEDVRQIKIPQVEEDGSSYYENALKKAWVFQKTYQLPVLTDDSGLEVDLLQGDPGIYSARYGGEGLSQPEKWAFLHQKLGQPTQEPWTARFRCVLCFFDGKRVPYFFEGVTEGWIVSQPKGSRGFGYDPIFYSPLLKKTFGEAEPEEKESVSHRIRALRDFVSWYRPFPPALE